MTLPIERITHIRAFGSFRDWSDDGLPPFKRYNLVYGWNGAGKSTLARLFRIYELGDATGVGHSISEDTDWGIEVGSGGVLGPGDAEGATVAVRVFSEDFINDNLLFDDCRAGSLLILGKESVDLQERIDQLTESAATAEANLSELRKKLNAAKNLVEDSLSGEARVIKLRLSRDPSDSYANYDKADLRDTLDNLEASPTVEVVDSEEEERLSRSRLPAIPLPDMPETKSLEMSWERLEEAVQVTVTDGVIEALRSIPGLQEWVETGLHLHENRSDVCLFCDQPLPQERIESLGRHFSDSYTEIKNQLLSVSKELSGVDISIEKFVGSATAVGNDRFYARLQLDWANALAGLEEPAAELRRLIRSGLGAIQSKLDDPFAPIDAPNSIEHTAETVRSFRSAVARLFHVAADHEKISTGIAADRREAQNRLEVAAARSFRESHDKRSRSVETLAKAVASAESTASALKSDLDGAKALNLGQSQAAEHLNEHLSAYFGHDLLQVRPIADSSVDFGLELQRGGMPATKLSEGERRGIALVYFLLKLQEASCDLAKSVIVLDDPVSSLDANHLYQAFAFLLRATEPAGQVFVLTHDFHLFRLFRDRYKHDYREDRELFMVVGDIQEKRVSSRIAPLASALKNHSEYHFLFSQIRKFASDGEGTGEIGYAMPNMARRLLETFLAFRVPTGQSLNSKILDSGFDGAKAQRITRFINDHSHSSGIAVLESIGVIGGDEARPVCLEILELMEYMDEDHFAHMQTFD